MYFEVRFKQFPWKGQSMGHNFKMMVVCWDWYHKKAYMYSYDTSHLNHLNPKDSSDYLCYISSYDQPPINKNSGKMVSFQFFTNSFKNMGIHIEGFFPSAYSHSVAGDLCLKTELQNSYEPCIRWRSPHLRTRNSCPVHHWRYCCLYRYKNHLGIRNRMHPELCMRRHTCMNTDLCWRSDPPCNLCMIPTHRWNL